MTTQQTQTGCDCIPREDMPQVNPQDIPALLDFLQKEGITHFQGWIDPRLLNGRQKISRHRVRSLTPSELESPLLISSDLLIIDGNHRWLGHLVRRTAAPYIQFNDPFDAAIEIIKKFPLVYFEDQAGDRVLRAA